MLSGVHPLLCCFAGTARFYGPHLYIGITITFYFAAVLTLLSHISGHSTPAAVARQLTADVEATLTLLTDKLDSDSHTTEPVTDDQVASEADVETLAEPSQGTAGIAKDAPQQQPELPSLAESEFEFQMPARLTADVGATVADLSAAAVEESESGSRADGDSVSVSETAQPERLTADVDETLAELSASTMTEAAQAYGDQPFLQFAHEQPRESHPVRLTADVNDALSSSAVDRAAEPPQDVSPMQSSEQLPTQSLVQLLMQSPVQSHDYWLAVGLHMPGAQSDSGVSGLVTPDVGATQTEWLSSAVSNAAEVQVAEPPVQSIDYWLAVGLHMPEADSDSVQPGRMTEDVDATLADLSTSADQPDSPSVDEPVEQVCSQVVAAVGVMHKDA